MSLFGGAATARANSQFLVEFKAGKMFMKPGNMVNPDARKGLIYIYQSDDSLMHFCWKDRTSGEVVDDLIIFPDDVMFKQIPPARISAARCDRIFVLKFKASSRKFFFWMQEPKSDKDEENCSKVNDLLNNPPAPGSRRGGTDGSAGLGGLSDLAGLGGAEGHDLQSLLGNMSQQQLMQLLASGGLGLGGLPGLLGGSGSRPSTGQSISGSTPASASGARASAPATTTTTTTTAAATTTTTAPATPAPVSANPTVTTASARATVSSTPSSSAAGNAIQLSDLQSILSSMNLPGASAESPDEKLQAASIASASDNKMAELQEEMRQTELDLAIVQTLEDRRATLIATLEDQRATLEDQRATCQEIIKLKSEKVDLASVITPENVAPVLNNDHSDLLQHLPQGEGLGQTPDELRQTLGSPQFQQAMGSFQAALQSGQLGPLMNQFGMTSDVSAAASQGNVEAFMQAMQQTTSSEEKEEEEEEEKKKKKKKEEDELDDDLDLE